MPRASDYLLDIEALDADGEPVTIRLATCPYITRHSDTPASVEYTHAIQDPGNFSSNLFDEGRTIGASHTGTGARGGGGAGAGGGPGRGGGRGGRPGAGRRGAGPGRPGARAGGV